MCSASGAVAATIRLAFESATTFRSHTFASASGPRGGCRWTSTSCSYVPPAPNGTRYTVAGKIEYQSSGIPSIRRS